jgi:hypothetical protein
VSTLSGRDGGPSPSVAEKVGPRRSAVPTEAEEWLFQTEHWRLEGQVRFSTIGCEGTSRPRPRRHCVMFFPFKPERFRRLQPQRTPMGTKRGKRCGLSGRIRITKREPSSEGKSVRLSLGYPCSQCDPWFQLHDSGLGHVDMRWGKCSREDCLRPRLRLRVEDSLVGWRWRAGRSN